jgi:GT2 family glycosyltransferase
MRPPFSLVIVFHAGTGYLQAYLESVLASVRPDDEIIVVANNAKKHRLDLPQFPDRVKIVKYAKALGYAGASNIGAEQASHDYLVFCDHDLVFQPGWLEYLWASYAVVPEIGAASIAHRFRCRSSAILW